MLGVEVRPMHGGVTAGTPAAAEFQFIGVVFVADQDLPRANERALRLRVALEAKIIVALDEHLAVDRAVRTVTNSAAFSHGFVLKDERLGLIAMTLRARLIEPRHREAASGLHDVRTVWVMALDTTHFAFEDGMMLREAERGVGFDVAIQTTRRVLAGIENKFPTAATDGDVQAAGAVAGFAAARADFDVWDEMHPRVRTGRELPDVIGVTGQAGLIADVVGSGNFGRDDDLAWNGGTGIQAGDQCGHKNQDAESRAAAKPFSPMLKLRYTHETCRD